MSVGIPGIGIGLTRGGLSPPLTNLVQWQKMGAGQTLVTSTAAADVCSAWADRTGLTHDLLNAIGSQQPTAPGDGTMVFDGANDFMRTLTYALAGAVTVALRVKPITWTAGDYVFDGFTANGGVLTQRGVTPAVDIYAGAFAATNTNLAVGAWATVIVVFNGAGSVLSVNGVETTGNPGAAAMAGFTLGGAGVSGSQFSNIQVAEVAVYAEAADVAKRAAIKAYFDTVVPPVVPAFAAYQAYGDSITAGFGVATAWPTLLAASPFVGVTANLAVSGDQAIDTGVALYPQAAGNALILIGTNDQRTGGYGSNATKRAHWKQFVTAMLAWRAMGTKTTGQASVNTSGTWANSAVFGGSLAVQSSVSGSQRTITTNGDVAWIWTVIQDGQTGTWKVTEGGVTKATGATAPNAAIASINGISYGVVSTRISGLGVGAHTLVFETTNAALVYFVGAAGVTDQAGVFNKVYSGNVISPNATGLASFGVDEANVSTAYGTDHAAAVASVFADTGSVFQVDTHALTVSYQADGLHPDQTGQQQIADKFKSTMGV